MKTNDDVYKNIPDVVAMQYRKISNKYIAMIAKKLREIGELSASDIHKIRQMGMYAPHSDVMKIEYEISELSGKTMQELLDVYEAMAEKSISASQDLAIIQGMRIEPYKYNSHLQNTVNAVSKMTAKTFRNLSNTTAIRVRFTDTEGNTIHKTMYNAYRDAVDDAIRLVSMGYESYDSMIAKTIKEFNESGLRYVDYESGYSRRLDSAVRQNVLDGMRDVYQGIQDELSKQLGCNGIEISAHGLCAPDHLPYQGRQYTYKEFEEIQNSLPRPFGYWNCRHSWTGIIIGVSEPAYSEKELKQYEEYSNEQITYNRKTMTRYEATQEFNRLMLEKRKHADLAKLYKIEGNDEKRRNERMKENAYRNHANELKKVIEK